MATVQMYETTVLETSEQYGFKFVVFPSRSLAEEVSDLIAQSENAPKAIAEYLRLRDFEYIERHSIDTLSTDIAEIIRREKDDELERYRPFAQYIAYTKLVPIEESPLGAEALATIAASSVKAGTVTVGVTVGFIVAGATPFLLITVPLGIILCGSAISFAKWVEENRTAVWSKLFGISNQE